MSKSSVPSTEEMDGAISPLPVAKGEVYINMQLLGLILFS